MSLPINMNVFFIVFHPVKINSTRCRQESLISFYPCTLIAIFKKKKVTVSQTSTFYYENKRRQSEHIFPSIMRWSRWTHGQSTSVRQTVSLLQLHCTAARHGAAARPPPACISMNMTDDVQNLCGSAMESVTAGCWTCAADSLGLLSFFGTLFLFCLAGEREKISETKRALRPPCAGLTE